MTDAMTGPDLGPAAGEWLLHELDQLQGCEITKAKVKDLLRRMAGQRIWLPKSLLVGPERVKLALAMLDAGFTPTQARRELSARTRISKSAAHRFVTEALKQRSDAATRSTEP